MCCLCNSAFKNGPWGCSQVLPPPCLCDTHTNTHKDDDDFNDDDDDDEGLCSTQSTELEPVSGQARAGFSRPRRCLELPDNSGLRETLTRNSGSRGSEAAPPGPGPARLTCDASPGDALHHGLHGGDCGYWDRPCGQTLRLHRQFLGRRPLSVTPGSAPGGPIPLSCGPPTSATPIHQLAPPMSITLTCHLSVTSPVRGRPRPIHS